MLTSPPVRQLSVTSDLPDPSDTVMDNLQGVPSISVGQAECECAPGRHCDRVPKKKIDATASGSKSKSHQHVSDNSNAFPSLPIQSGAAGHFQKQSAAPHITVHA